MAFIVPISIIANRLDLLGALAWYSSVQQAVDITSIFLRPILVGSCLRANLTPRSAVSVDETRIGRRQCGEQDGVAG